MRILILSPNQISRYNWGHQLFRNEIGRQHNVLYYGQMYPSFDPKLKVNQIIKKHYKERPDLILTYGWRYSQNFKGLGKITDIPKVHITVDYGRPKGIIIQNEFFKENKYDLVFAITKNAYKLMSKNKVCDKIEIIPFSVDTNHYKPLNLPEQNIILTAYTDRTDVYPNRKKVRKVLSKAGHKLMSKRVVHKSLINWINRSKIIVTSNNIFHSMSMRYTETLACGGFLLADKPEGMDLLGFKDGVHFVIYNDMNDLVDKVKFYMSHDKKRRTIAKQGMKFVRKNHSCKVRVKEMTEHIKRNLGI